ncbi:15-hydroxyprostaglandin dehydrogenase [NAD(+)]-like [Phlebotomus argentipes]|uniref:15-hydroxyprostaglandin dehydrogenase [NAD(+)]-like n=1 Tax=Phlebotomus argentipes TaxID=94469 RepID=UPI0028930794|nr:15-hydroxyprostaglandin dehydrogenase [NAD(+)]-like [Phlebotomus argentipes]
MSFRGQSALVTGGTGAIGGAICEELLKSGVKHLAALDLSAAEPKVVAEWRQKFPSASVKYFQVDVSSHEQLEKCYAEFVKEIKSLDIVVNCAGIFDEKIYRKVVEVNLCGVIGSTLIALEHMRKDKGNGKGGMILNISSVAGITPMSVMPTYCATKHGVTAFTRALAHEREYLGIKFFILCPGGTKSQLYDIFLKPDCFFMSSEAKLDILKKGFPDQSPVVVGKATVKIMQNAKSGSVWLVENGKTTEVTLPEIQF